MSEIKQARIVTGRDGLPVQLAEGGLMRFRTDLPIRFSDALGRKLVARIRKIHEDFPMQGKPQFRIDPEKQKPVPRWAPVPKLP